MTPETAAAAGTVLQIGVTRDVLLLAGIVAITTIAVVWMLTRPSG